MWNLQYFYVADVKDDMYKNELFRTFIQFDTFRHIVWD